MILALNGTSRGGGIPNRTPLDFVVTDHEELSVLKCTKLSGLMCLKGCCRAFCRLPGMMPERGDRLKIPFCCAGDARLARRGIPLCPILMYVALACGGGWC